jgi:ankyrin repeat protein
MKPYLFLPLVLSVFTLFGLNLAYGNNHMNQEEAVLAIVQLSKAQDEQGMQKLLESGITINSFDREGQTAVLLVTKENNNAALRFLVKFGADIDAYAQETSLIDQTAFLYAGANGLNEILSILIPENPDVTITNGYGGTALIPAAEKGHVETVKLLLEQTQVDVNHVNNLGWTALMEAVVLSDGREAHQEIVKLLLAHGADALIPDKKGVTALEHARNKGFNEIVELLEIKLDE